MDCRNTRCVINNTMNNNEHVINNTMNNIITENSRQVSINRGIDSRIQHLSRIVNHLSEDRHTVEINLFMAILNIDTVQHQIEILEDAFLLTKNGIPSSRIFHVKDLRKIQQFLETHQIVKMQHTCFNE